MIWGHDLRIMTALLIFPVRCPASFIVILWCPRINDTMPYWSSHPTLLNLICLLLILFHVSSEATSWRIELKSLQQTLHESSIIYWMFSLDIHSRNVTAPQKYRVRAFQVSFTFLFCFFFSLILMLLNYMESSSSNRVGFFFIWLLNCGLAKYLAFSATIFNITS